MKNKKIKFKELLKSLRIPISKPTRVHRSKKKQDMIADVRKRDDNE